MSLIAEESMIGNQFKHNNLTSRKQLNFQQYQSTAILNSPSSEIPLPTSEVELIDNNNCSDLDIDQDQESPPPSPPPAPTVNVRNQPRPLVSIPTASESACDPTISERPSHVSLLAGKYLLFANSTGSSSGTGTANSSRDLQKCINVETREQFSCKIVPRNATGLGLLAAYHRLEEFSDCIGAIHEIVLSPKLVYIIFPLNYGSVHSYILAKKKLSEPEAALLFKQIVSAVHYCHGKGIVLRDLKMGKFVFCDKERTQVKLESLEDAVILSDFSDDSLSDKHGCPNYVSPEKADILRSNSKYPGKATDIWGLGIILYTMLVGKYPFNDADHTRLFGKIRKCHFTIPENLSHQVKCLLRCLLRKDPSGRLNCQQILSHPWLLNNGCAPPTPTPTPRRPADLNNSRSRRNATESAQPQPSSEQNDDQVVPEFNVL